MLIKNNLMFKLPIVLKAEKAMMLKCPEQSRDICLFRGRTWGTPNQIIMPIMHIAWVQGVVSGTREWVPTHYINTHYQSLLDSFGQLGLCWTRIRDRHAKGPFLLCLSMHLQASNLQWSFYTCTIWLAGIINSGYEHYLTGFSLKLLNVLSFSRNLNASMVSIFFIYRH